MKNGDPAVSIWYGIERGSVMPPRLNELVRVVVRLQMQSPCRVFLKMRENDGEWLPTGMR